MKEPKLITDFRNNFDTKCILGKDNNAVDASHLRSGTSRFNLLTAKKLHLYLATFKENDNVSKNLFFNIECLSKANKATESKNLYARILNEKKQMLWEEKYLSYFDFLDLVPANSADCKNIKFEISPEATNNTDRNRNFLRVTKTNLKALFDGLGGASWQWAVYCEDIERSKSIKRKTLERSTSVSHLSRHKNVIGAHNIIGRKEVEKKTVKKISLAEIMEMSKSQNTIRGKKTNESFDKLEETVDDTLSTATSDLGMSFNQIENCEKGIQKDIPVEKENQCKKVSTEQQTIQETVTKEEDVSDQKNDQYKTNEQSTLNREIMSSNEIEMIFDEEDGEEFNDFCPVSHPFKQSVFQRYHPMGLRQDENTTLQTKKDDALIVLKEIDNEKDQKNFNKTEKAEQSNNTSVDVNNQAEKNNKAAKKNRYKFFSFAAWLSCKNIPKKSQDGVMQPSRKI